MPTRYRDVIVILTEMFTLSFCMGTIVIENALRFGHEFHKSLNLCTLPSHNLPEIDSSKYLGCAPSFFLKSDTTTPRNANYIAFA